MILPHSLRLFLEVLKYLLLVRRCNPLSLLIDGGSILHLSAKYGHLNCLKFLIEEIKLDINRKDAYGDNVFIWAIVSGNLSVIKFLGEEKKFDLKQVSKRSRGSTLHIAAQYGHFEAVKYLLEIQPFDFNKVDISDSTVLHHAICSKNFDVVEYLVKKGAFSPHSMQNKTKFEILNFIIQKSESLPILRYFLEKIGIPHNLSNDETGFNLVHAVAYCKEAAIIKYLIEEKKIDTNIKDSRGFNALHFAAQTGCLATIIYLIEQQKLDPHTLTSDSTNALHLAALGGHLNVVQYLIDMQNMDIDINVPGKGNSLHLAVMNGHRDLCQYLIETKKMDPSKLTDAGNDCLKLITVIKKIATKAKMMIEGYLPPNERIITLAKNLGSLDNK